ncbi:MAG: ABC transporter ATP-binding protein [Planctomycetes bacterium]|nr:ABC transporter ATP-binding protein [Planctomycetota bacterium]
MGAVDLAIEVRGLEKRYRGKRGVHALRGVDLGVARGEIYGLLGRNGAGKTTLVKILLDIVRASAGSAALLGEPSRAVHARRRVGYLPEDHRFPDYQTGLSAMEFYARLSDVSRVERKRRVPELLELVGLKDAAARKVRGYSKGMKQRLGLAQALVHDPAVLFLDEPTDGVDPVGRAEIRDVLLRVRGEGRTIFLNSHLLSEVEQICDRVGILEAGRLAREGTIEELTRVSGAWKLELDREADVAMQERLRAHALRVATHGRELHLEVAEEAALDRCVDLLREQRYGLRGLSGGRASLEQVFLATVEEEVRS